ncbi:GTPase-activating protein, partial [Tulasnella sp. 408]
IVSFIAAFVTGFVLAYIKSWRLALALSSILPCIVITGGVMQKFEGKYRTFALNAIAEGGTLAEEVISTVRTAQAFGTQKILSGLYDVHVAKAHAAERKVAIIHGIGLGIFFFVIYASYALAFSFGTTLILQGHANAGIIVNVFLAILIGAFSLALMAPEAQAVANARAAAAKLYATIDRVPPIDAANEGGQRPEKIIGEIRFENVKFHYPSRPNVPILKGLNVTFQAGKTAALVGASGSGKSTVVSLVERFYDPIEGNVYLDGVNVKDLNLKWLRQQIGLVQQEPSLFATTIKGNVAHGLIGSRFENLPEDEKFNLIKDACIKANAHSFIEKLPLGYDTMVGERGFLLSGGQKQRIAIARAIVSDPRILLLDEATSALDTQSEGIVQDALDKAAAGRTTITIAHRLSTIRDADQIYVVGAGEIIEHGTHNELLANENGPYSQLVNAQKLKGRDPASRDSEEAEETTAEPSENACIPFVISAGYIRLRVVVLKDQTNKVAHEESAQMACEAAGAVRTVQSLTREEETFQEYSRSLEGPLQKSNRTATLSTGLFALSQALSFFVIALVFWYGSRLVASLEYGTFEFFVCLMSVVFGSIQAGNVFGFVPDISAAKGAANDIVNLIDQVPEIDAWSPDGVKVDDKTIQGHIRFEDVHFRYPTRPGVRVLRNLNLVVEPGTYVALVGASGCGKSTTIQLIERFYDPLAGRVLLDGNDISTLNVNDYRKNIALVSQEPTLYAGTIRFNILLGATKPAAEVTQEEIEQACRDANILEFIQSLPNGFDTEVGGKGSQLSGGQKQRIAIARALLRNPKVLLLDEATSALDSQSEKVVQAALDNAAKGRTTIAIAHRLSTIQNADRIYFFKDGRVAEAGTHDELLAKRGGYYELVQLQALSKI